MAVFVAKLDRIPLKGIGARSAEMWRHFKNGRGPLGGNLGGKSQDVRGVSTFTWEVGWACKTKKERRGEGKGGKVTIDAKRVLNS